MATGNTPKTVIDDIKTSRDNIAQSIRNKGVSVPTDAKLSDLSAKVSSIVTPNLQSATVDPNPDGQTIKPDSSHNGLSEVKVNKMASAVAKASGSITNTSATASPGTVSIAKNTTSVSGKTRLDVTPTTSTSDITGSHYMAVQATAAANTTGTSVTASGTASAGISTAGYAPTTLSESADISGTFTAKTSSKSSSVYYLPIPTETITVTPSENPQSINASSGKLISSVNVERVPDKYIDTTVSSNAVGSGDIRAGKKAFVNKQLVTGDLPELDAGGTPVLFAPSTNSEHGRGVDYDSSNNPHLYRTYPVSFLDNVNPYGNDDVHAGEVITQEVSLKIYEEELGDATAANVLTGTKFTSRDGFAIDGEMPQSSTGSATSSTTATAARTIGYGQQTTITKGYYSSDRIIRNSVGAVSGSIGGSATSGKATAAISNVHGMTTLVSTTGKTAGTDYFTVKATATGTAGGYTPKYTVNTAGYIGSTVTGTNQTVSVSGDSTGKSIHIPRAVFEVDGNTVKTTVGGYIPSNTPVGTVEGGGISANIPTRYIEVIDNDIAGDIEVSTLVNEGGKLTLKTVPVPAGGSVIVSGACSFGTVFIKSDSVLWIDVYNYSSDDYRGYEDYYDSSTGTFVLNYGIEDIYIFACC